MHNFILVPNNKPKYRKKLKNRYQEKVCTERQKHGQTLFRRNLGVYQIKRSPLQKKIRVKYELVFDLTHKHVITEIFTNNPWEKRNFFSKVTRILLKQLGL